jgi:hypothetical protein
LEIDAIFSAEFEQEQTKKFYVESCGERFINAGFIKREI